VGTWKSPPKVHHELREFADVDEVASAAADFVAELAHDETVASGTFTCALSGGRTPQRMFVELDARVMPWDRTVLYQVDERVAPMGDPQRNLVELVQGLATSAPVIESMPVDEADLDSAAQNYAALLPARLDLVHLGLGPDGHTASLVPGDPALEETDQLVTLTGPYQGYRRMTMTYPALARANQLLWLVTGEEKREALSKLLAGDTDIPAGRVEARQSLIMADRSALS
jgi:6-phosphogluconolactonase